MGGSFSKIRSRPLQQGLTNNRLLLEAHRSGGRRLIMALKTYDAIIVGSGHAGGMAAKMLTEKGISCLMLNAGPEADYEKDRELKNAYDLPHRGFHPPGRLPP